MCIQKYTKKERNGRKRDRKKKEDIKYPFINVVFENNEQFSGGHLPPRPATATSHRAVNCLYICISVCVFVCLQQCVCARRREKKKGRHINSANPFDGRLTFCWRIRLFTCTMCASRFFFSYSIYDIFSWIRIIYIAFFFF